MKSRFLLAAVLAVLLPALASADDRTTAKPLTVTGVIELSRSHVSDDVILSQIDASGSVFRLTVDDILEMKEAGVSERVITYMINTGKNEGDGESEDAGETRYDANDRYHSSLDSRYYGGYDDPYWNIYLSWGYGRYYDPFYYAWWPDYSWYYYPASCFRTYWPYYYYPHYSYYSSGWTGDRHTRHYKDGRYISGRGGSRRSPAYGGTTRSPRGGRDYKGSYGGSYGGRGSSSPNRSGTSGSSGGGRAIKPSYGGRGEKSPPPATSEGTRSTAPSKGTSGRTMKKS